MLTAEEIFTEENRIGGAGGKFLLNGQEHSIHKVLVTPEVAAAILDLNTKNRGWRREQSKKYGKDFIRKTWKNNGDNISIGMTDDGGLFLANGQHRLRSIAALEEGFSIELMFFLGVKEDALKTIDAGVARVTRDHLTLSGVNETAATMISSAVITMMMTEEDLWSQPDSTRQRRIIPEGEKLDFVKANETGSVAAIVGNRNTALDFRVSDGSRALVIPFAPLASAFAYIWKADADSAVEFFTALSTGYYRDGSAPAKDSPVAVMRHEAQRVHGLRKQKKIDAVQPGWWVRGLLFAWESWYTGKTIVGSDISKRLVTNHDYEWVVPSNVVVEFSGSIAA